MDHKMTPEIAASRDFYMTHGYAAHTVCAACREAGSHIVRICSCNLSCCPHVAITEGPHSSGYHRK